MMPNEASKERKPKHDLESLADGMETEAAEPGMPDFMKDAEALLALEAKRDKMIDQKSELSSASNVLELKPGAATGAIDKEINGLQDKVNAVLGKYGKEANAFQVDAYRVGELKDNVGDAEAILRSLESEYKNEKNRDAKAKLERQIEDATAAWQEARGELAGMKDKYVAKEAAAKAELAGATDAEIDAALEPLDRKGSTVEVGEVSDEEAEQIRDMDEMSRETDDAIKMTMDASAEAIREKDEMAKETDDAIKMAMDASAEALKEKDDRAKAMEARVDARMKEEDEMAKETDDAIKMAMEASAEAIKEKDEMAKETADAIKMAMEASAEAIKEKEDMKRETDDAIKMAIETSAEALAEEGRRDTMPDAGIAARMEKVAEAEDEVMEVEEGELIDEPADDKVEDEFFQGAGQTLESRSAAERRGDVGAERHEMTMRADALRSQMPEMNRQLARAEKLLSDLGVKDVDAAMAKRAMGGFAEKAKGFLGGLFSKKTRELNHAMGLYESIRDQHNEKAEELAKLENQLNPSDRYKDMQRIASENRQGR